MRILFIIDDFKGGAANSSQLLCQSLSKNHDIVLLALNKSVESRYDKINYNVVVGKTRRMSKSVMLIKRTIKDFKPEVVVSFLFGVSVFTYIALLFNKRISFICSERSNPFVLKPSAKMKPLVSMAYKRADKLVLLSSNFLGAYKSKIQKKCVIIPNIVPVLPFNCIHKKNGKKRIVTYGNNVFYKGYDLIVESIPYILKERNDFIIEIYGSFNKDKLNQRIEELNIKDNIILLDYEINIFNILNGAYGYLFASRIEGFPNALVEGLSSGLPVIAYPCHEGIKDIVQDRYNGILIDEYSPTGIAESILKLLGISSNEYDILSKNAKLVVEKYSEIHITEKWEKLFYECSKRR